MHPEGYDSVKESVRPHQISQDESGGSIDVFHGPIQMKFTCGCFWGPIDGSLEVEVKVALAFAIGHHVSPISLLERNTMCRAGGVWFYDPEFR